MKLSLVYFLCVIALISLGPYLSKGLTNLLPLFTNVTFLESSASFLDTLIFWNGVIIFLGLIMFILSRRKHDHHKHG
jgi:hypothetical protein